MGTLISTAVGMLVAISMALSSGFLYAQEVGKTKELSPGRVRKNLGEIPANIPGYEKVRMVEDTAKPGAAWKTKEGVGMPYPMFCTLLKGEITTVMGGVKTVRKAGDSWTCKKGDMVEAKSTGSESSVMRMHHLLKAGDN